MRFFINSPMRKRSGIEQYKKNKITGNWVFRHSSGGEDTLLRLKLESKIWLRGALRKGDRTGIMGML